MELFDLEIPIRATGGQAVKAQFDELEAKAKITDARISKPSTVKVEGVAQATTQLTTLGNVATETAAAVAKPSAVTIDGIPQAVAQLASIGTAATEAGRFTVDAINRQIAASMAGASASDVQRETVLALQQAETEYTAALKAGTLTAEQAITVDRELASVRKALAAVPSATAGGAVPPLIPPDLTPQVTSVSAAILSLQTRAAQLRSEFRANDITAIQYSRSMATLNAEVRALAATEGLTATETRALNGLLVRTTTAARGFASQGLDVVRLSAISLAPTLLGTSGAAGAIAGSLLAFSTGGLVTIGIVAGMAVMGGAVKLFTGKITEARREADELNHSLAGLGRSQAQQLQAQLTKAEADAEIIRKNLAANLAIVQAERAAAGFSLAGAINAVTHDLEKDAKLLGETEATIKRLREALQADSGQSRAAQISDIVRQGQAVAENIRLKGADAAATRNALAWETLLTKIGNDRTRGINEQNAALSAAASIHDALNPKEKRTREEQEKASDIIRDQVALLSEMAGVRSLTGDETARLGDIIATVDRLQASANLTDAEQLTLLKARIEAVKLLAAATAATIPQHPTFGRDLSIGPKPAALPTGFNEPKPAPVFGGGFGDLAGGGAGSALKSIDTLGPQVKAHGVTLGKELSAGFASGFADDIKDTAGLMATGLSDAITGAFESAFSGGGIAGIFTGFGKAILAALGGIFTQMGTAMIAASPIFQALSAALWNPFTAGGALLAEGAALVALGASLGAIAHSGSGGHAATGTGSTAPTSQIIYYHPERTALIGSTKSAMTASTIPVVRGDTFNNTFFGTNDPVAQRDFGKMYRLAKARGLT